jgi:hypothetical protein
MTAATDIHAQALHVLYHLDKMLRIDRISLTEYAEAVSEVARWANEAAAKISPDDRPDEQIYWDVHFEADLAEVLLARLNGGK